MKKHFNNFTTEKVKYPFVFRDKEINISLTIIFFSDNNSPLSDALKSEVIGDVFKRTGFKLLFYNNLSFSREEEQAVNFFFNPKQAISKRANTKNFLNAFNYNGDIKEGFLIMSDDTFVVNTEFEPVNKVVNSIIAFLNFNSIENISGSRRRFPESFIKIDDNLDNDAKQKLKRIEEEIISLRNNGKLVLVLPYLEKIIEEQCEANDSGEIIIDDDYNISLKDYPLLDLPFNAMTRVVYVLFFQYKKINITELHRYKTQIIEIYKVVSNASDYDKMMKTVEDLINPESNSIYTHISRIKAVFYSKLHPSIAENYIIKSDEFGSKIKYIPTLNRMSELEKALFRI